MTPLNKIHSALHNGRMGFILVCTDKSEKTMLDNLVFPQSVVYGYKVFAINPEDYIFLYNLDTDTLHGVFVAVTEGRYEPNLSLFNGKYPYYVKVKVAGEIKQLKNTKAFFNRIGYHGKII